MWKLRDKLLRVRWLPSCRKLVTSREPGKLFLAHLHNRCLLRICGKDSAKFLQNLITNNVNLLRFGRGALFALFLNAQGRTLFDVLVYRLSEKSDEYFVEVSREQASDALGHMQRYKLRSKVDIEDLNNTCKVYAAFRESVNYPLSNLVHSVPNGFPDPRLARLGARVLEFDQQVDADRYEHANIDTYRRHRYELGICEGPEEYENGMPLEYNMALLNGVSFDKGCYIGQELIARAHHTGVIRKRVMPIALSQNNGNAEASLPPGTSIWSSSKKKKVGKLICYNGNRGLAMMRLAETIHESGPLIMETENNVTIHVVAQQPEWWPADLPY